MIQFNVISVNSRATNVKSFKDVAEARQFAEHQVSTKDYTTVSVNVVVDCWVSGTKIHPSED